MEDGGKLKDIFAAAYVPQPQPGLFCNQNIDDG